jgi:ATP synthase subunit 6
MPFTFTLFTFILVSNLIGMTFYGFTTTSHIAVTFTLSFSFFIAVVALGFYMQSYKFLYLFVPSGAPKPMVPFLVLIEVISFLSRPFSLGIRLFANMMSGHTLLAILSGFTVAIINYNIFLGFLPIALITCIVGLEMFIAGLQAYVFTVLVCIYAKESIYGH